MDELAKRRIIRNQRRQAVPPPMDGSVDQVLEDLTIVQGMVTEIVAETRAIPVVPEDLHKAVIILDDAANHAHAVAQGLVDDT